ncbi:hypothetical protein B0H14DRAFT_2973074 [Mycena olivaceomarginata]|nr:hypothetical protein B0H14DRAFT_2973074 [Mycena olivaceomarginata]
MNSLLYALLAVFQIRLLVVAKFFSEEDETKSKLGCRRSISKMHHFSQERSFSQLLCYPHRRLLPIIHVRPTRNILVLIRLLQRLCAGYLLFATAVASRPRHH